MVLTESIHFCIFIVMKFLELRRAIGKNIFAILDVKKYFPKEKDHSLRIQLSRFRRKGLIYPIKRGWYCFQPDLVNEFELANKLYQPSYISLETALNYYGVIPDISRQVVSITPVKTKRIVSQFGSFSYCRIKPELFWGYQKVSLPGQTGFFLIAQKEKALLDFFT